jgi:hypothetical protein
MRRLRQGARPVAQVPADVARGAVHTRHSYDTGKTSLAPQVSGLLPGGVANETIVARRIVEQAELPEHS